VLAASVHSSPVLGPENRIVTRNRLCGKVLRGAIQGRSFGESARSWDFQ
jgi:hypothetical protein